MSYYLIIIIRSCGVAVQNALSSAAVPQNRRRRCPIAKRTQSRLRHHLPGYSPAATWSLILFFHWHNKLLSSEFAHFYFDLIVIRRRRFCSASCCVSSSCNWTATTTSTSTTVLTLSAMATRYHRIVVCPFIVSQSHQNPDPDPVPSSSSSSCVCTSLLPLLLLLLDMYWWWSID